MLQYAIDNDIINPETLLIQIEMNERKRYLEMHNHKIWQGANGFWYTKVDDDSKKDKRRTIKKRNEEEIEDSIIEYYKQKENEPLITDIFYGWLNKKLDFGEIQKQTYERYEVDFKRFFVATGFDKRKIKYITEYELEEFIKTTIYNNSLTSRAWGNLRSIISGMFKYAKKKGYTNISITTFLGDLDLSKKAFRKNVKIDNERIFSLKEMDLLLTYLSSNPTLSNLAIMFAAYTGMRVGEIVALKWEDIDDKSITIHRTQVVYHDDNGRLKHDIRDFPKTEAGIRNVVIIDGLRPVIKKLRIINPFTEYVFWKDGKIATKNMIEKSLYRACDKVNIPRRSMHTLRRTYATKLINSKKIDEAVIINQMGHTDIDTTKGYYYFNDKTLDTISELISGVIKY